MSPVEEIYTVIDVITTVDICKQSINVTTVLSLTRENSTSNNNIGNNFPMYRHSTFDYNVLS